MCFSITANTAAEECLIAGQSAVKTGDFEAGLIALQQGRNILTGSSNSQLILQLNTKIAEIHYQKGNYKETVDECEHILSILTPTAHSLEFLQALFYLIYSHIELKQLKQRNAIVKKWTGKLSAECTRCKCEWRCTQGMIYYAICRNR